MTNRPRPAASPAAYPGDSWPRIQRRPGHQITVFPRSRYHGHGDRVGDIVEVVDMDSKNRRWTVWSQSTARGANSFRTPNILLVFLNVLVFGCSTRRSSEDDWVAVSTSTWHSCGLKEDGRIECWGCQNTQSGLEHLEIAEHGQCDAPGGEFTAVSTGPFNTCGLTADGSIQCWGWCADGQCDAPDATYDSVSVGEFHACGIVTDGDTVCWGDTEYGATDVPEASFATVSAGFVHSCGLTNDGIIECWGCQTGQDPDESSAGNKCEAPSGKFVSVDAGKADTCGIREDGEVECWGSTNPDDWDSSWGELEPIPSGAFIDVASGSGRVFCGSRPDGSVDCWGWCSFGGSDGKGPCDVLPGEYHAVSTGEFETCGLSTDGRIGCWGLCYEGQCDPP